MKKKTKAEKLADFKKANQERKLKLAQKEGYLSKEEYLNYLIGKKVKVQPVTKLPVIHNVHILDASGSMSGSKFTNAVLGINNEIKELKLSQDAVYYQTIVDFSSDIKFSYLNASIQGVEDYQSRTRGSTALYQAIGETLEKLQSIVKTGEKVLVKIFTDGEENASRGKYDNSITLRNLIKECEAQGFTITFVGTPNDVRNIIKQLSIDESNTLVHNNTASDVKRAFEVSSLATKTYATKVAAGEEVLTGFYKTTL